MHSRPCHLSVQGIAFIAPKFHSSPKVEFRHCQFCPLVASYRAFKASSSNSGMFRLFWAMNACLIKM